MSLLHTEASHRDTWACGAFPAVQSSLRRSMPDRRSRARGPGLRAPQVDEHQGKVHLGRAAPGKPR